MTATQFAAELGPPMRLVQLDELCDVALSATRGAMCAKGLRISLAIRDGFMEIPAPEDHLRWALSALLGLGARLAARGSNLRLEAAHDRRAHTLLFCVRFVSPCCERAHRQLEHLRARRLLALVGGSVVTTQDHGIIELRVTVPLAGENEPANDRPTETPVSHERVARVARELLIVEDDDHNVATVGEYLDARGYDIRVARDGHEAIAMARRYHPALILMDVQLPGMDGLAATRALRADVRPEVSRVPIIALTAMAMTGDRARCLAAGADDYLTKPVSLKKLAALIEERLQTTQVPCGKAENDAHWPSAQHEAEAR